MNLGFRRRSRSSGVGRQQRSVPKDPLAARAFLQGRVETYLAYALGIWAIAFLSDRIRALIAYGALLAAPNSLYLVAHYAAIAVNGGLYLMARSGERSTATLRAMELFATLAQAALSASLLAQIPLAARPEFLALFAATLFLILRAGLVPGSVTLALAVGAASLAPSVLLAATLYSPPRILLGLVVDASSATSYVLQWSVMSLVATTAIHAVIYGLEERVQELGQYSLLHKIGEGGMGVVYRARHALLRRPTAVKLLPLDKTSAEGVARFEREVQLTAELAHPNIVSVYDFGKSPDGIFYYAMEYLDGVDLQRLVETHGPQSESRVVHLLRQAADALADAHQVGLVHRDIKPANLFLSSPRRRPDHLTVLDFGLASEFTADPARTAANEVRGTPLYMAPESITTPGQTDERCDVYALGAVAFFLLTATPPFRGATFVEICAAHVHAEPERPSSRLGRPIEKGLEALILSCLAKSPDARPKSAAELLDRLSALAIPRWSANDAEAWWQRHPAPNEAATAEGPRTLAVARHVNES